MVIEFSTVAQRQAAGRPAHGRTIHENHGWHAPLHPPMRRPGVEAADCLFLVHAAGTGIRLAATRVLASHEILGAAGLATAADDSLILQVIQNLPGDQQGLHQDNGLLRRDRLSWQGARLAFVV
ncbi:MAG: hypothetical protein ABR898_10915 [Terracidiphilus sp.]|jgi:hypothetical protein